jgi:hypothetical protein
MNFASFHDVRRLEKTLGRLEKTLGGYRLAEAMLRAEPGWISERSWEFWRGRLTLATGRTIPDAPPWPTWPLLSQAPCRNFGCGAEVDRFKEFRRLATAKPRLQSLWSELDDISIGGCRAGYHVVDATIR